MIVRPGRGEVHLITQPDHAALARRMMEHWVSLQAEPRQPSILHAIQEHDNGWQEPDAAPLVDPATGEVLDFVRAPAEVRQGVWPRAVARLAAQPWSAALVAQHAITVYDRFRTDPAWTAFFDEMTGTRDRLVKSSPHSPDELAHDYAYVRIGDLLSLIFCNAWGDEHSYGAWRFRLSGDALLVMPDPFDGREVPFEITARPIPDVAYASSEQLQQALSESSPLALVGTLRGASRQPA